MKMVIKGFRFGLLLQVAIGPVFLFVLKTATVSGILAAEAAVLAATLIDTIFVTFAILGIGALLDKPKLKSMLKLFGVAVLFYFGTGTILGSFHINIIPGITGFASAVDSSNAFIMGLVLTISNPLTILFWTGVFATKMADEGYTKSDMRLFGLGAVLTTLVILGFVAFLGGLLEPYMTENTIRVLNIIVGAILIGFAFRMLFTKYSDKKIAV